MRLQILQSSFIRRTYATRLGVAAAMLSFACLGVTSRPAAADDLSAVVRSARDRFTPVDKKQVDSARAALNQRIRELERFVGSGSNGRKWNTYLKLDALKQELSNEQPKFDPLVAAYQQLNRDENGLELPPFRRLSDAVHNYIDIAALAQQEDQTEVYGKQLESLERQLGEYEKQPTSKLGLSIGRQLEFVAGVGQAPEVVAAVREKFGRPNALVHVSSGLLAASAEPVNRSDHITDCILGTSLSGTAHTVGTVAVRTVPSDDRAKLELSSNGQVWSNNVGHNGPAVIRTTADTDYSGIWRVELSDKIFRSFPASVDAHTSSHIHSIAKKGGGLGSNMVSKIGWKKAREQHSQADAIASDHAEDRVARRINDDSTSALRDAWKKYDDEYRLPLVRRGELPEHIRFSTDQDSMHVEVTQATRGQLGASGDPPSLPAGKDLVMRVHETAANNYLAAILGGTTISETDPKQGTKADEQLPEFLKKAWEQRMDDKAVATDAKFEPWSLTFRRDRPVTLGFVGDKVMLTLHIAHLKSGEDEFERWDVTGTFKPELADGGVTLHREGEFEVLPTGFDPDKDQLSSRQVAVRRNLTKVLTERSDQGRGFPQSIEIEKLKPTDRFASVGPLDADQVTSASGWLTVAWNREHGKM